MTDWVPLLLTTLGAGAAGAIITTYGAQASDRRAARAKARECLSKAENLSEGGDISHEEITAAMDELEISAMIARLPRTLVDLHRVARVRLWAARIYRGCHPDRPCRHRECARRYRSRSTPIGSYVAPLA